MTVILLIRSPRELCDPLLEMAEMCSNYHTNHAMEMGFTSFRRAFFFRLTRLVGQQEIIPFFLLIDVRHKVIFPAGQVNGASAIISAVIRISSRPSPCVLFVVTVK